MGPLSPLLLKCLCSLVASTALGLLKNMRASQRICTSYCWMPRRHRLQAGLQQTPPGEAAEGHNPAPLKGQEAHLCSVGQTCLADAMATWDPRKQPARPCAHSFSHSCGHCGNKGAPSTAAPFAVSQTHSPHSSPPSEDPAFPFSRETLLMN